MDAAAAANQESEKAKRERAKTAREHGGKATPEQIQDRLSDGAVDKRSDKPKAQKVKKEAAELAVGEFTNFLQSVRNGTGAKNDLSSENPSLAETTDLESDGRPRHPL